MRPRPAPGLTYASRKALISHDSGNLHHRPSDDGGCDAVTEAAESSPPDRSRPVRLVAPGASLRHRRRRLDPVLRNTQHSMDNRRRRYRRSCRSRNGSNTPVPRLGLSTIPQTTDRGISRDCNGHQRTTFRVSAGTQLGSRYHRVRSSRHSEPSGGETQQRHARSH